MKKLFVAGLVAFVAIVGLTAFTAGTTAVGVMKTSLDQKAKYEQSMGF